MPSPAKFFHGGESSDSGAGACAKTRGDDAQFARFRRASVPNNVAKTRISSAFLEHREF
jgi:hypothetical protein